MDTLPFIAILSLLTFACFFIYARISKRRTEDRRHDPAAPKSTLAKDSPGKGAVEAMDDK